MQQVDVAPPSGAARTTIFYSGTIGTVVAADDSPRMIQAYQVTESLSEAWRCGMRTRSAARTAVNRAKVALGERGPVWWQDGAPDLNRRMVANTPYADWFEQLEKSR